VAGSDLEDLTIECLRLRQSTGAVMIHRFLQLAIEGCRDGNRWLPRRGPPDGTRGMVMFVFHALPIFFSRLPDRAGGGSRPTGGTGGAVGGVTLGDAAEYPSRAQVITML
jgi:hypothetical protein